MPKHNKNQIPLTEVYKHYKDNTEKPLDYKTHKAVLDLWGKKVREALVEGKDIKLYHGLSSLGIRKRVKKTYIDKRASSEAGKIIRRSNSHSGFFAAKLLWRRHYTKFNSNNWGFHTCRELQSMITDVMSTLNGHLRYMQKALIPTTEKQRKYAYTKNVLKL